MNPAQNNWALPLAVVLLVPFLGVTLLVRLAPNAIDELAITRRVQSITLKRLGALPHLINWPGYPPQVFVLSFLLVLVPLLFGWKWIAFTQVFAGLGVGLASTLVKKLLQRERPKSRAVVVPLFTISVSPSHFPNPRP